MERLHLQQSFWAERHKGSKAICSISAIQNRNLNEDKRNRSKVRVQSSCLAGVSKVLDLDCNAAGGKSNTFEVLSLYPIWEGKGYNQTIFNREKPSLEGLR